MPSFYLEAFRHAPLKVEVDHKYDAARGVTFNINCTLGSAYDAPKQQLYGLSTADLETLIAACQTALQDSRTNEDGETVSLEEIAANGYPFGKADDE